MAYAFHAHAQCSWCVASVKMTFLGTHGNGFSSFGAMRPCESGNIPAPVPPSRDSSSSASYPLSAGRLLPVASPDTVRPLPTGFAALLDCVGRDLHTDSRQYPEVGTPHSLDRYLPRRGLLGAGYCPGQKHNNKKLSGF